MNEITVSALLEFAKGALSDQFQIPLPPALAQFNMASGEYIKNAMSVPTTAGGTAIPLGSVTTPGWFLAVNRDPTNYVQVLNAVNGNALAKMMPGEPCLFRFAGAAPAMIANGAPCVVEYLLLNN